MSLNKEKKNISKRGVREGRRETNGSSLTHVQKGNDVNPRPPLTPARLWLAALLPSNYDKRLSHTRQRMGEESGSV